MLLEIDWNCSGNVINCTTLNGTERNDNLSDLIFYVTTSVILGLIILITIIGNVFVIAAILLDRNLQHVANYLIISLAVADLMVACLVMPLGAVYEVSFKESVENKFGLFAIDTSIYSEIYEYCFQTWRAPFS